jgi:hypothetical protein
MCDIPLDLQRRLEQRWAARFSRPAEAAKPEKHQPEKPDQPLAGPIETERKARRDEPAGLRAVTDGMSAGPKPAP